MVKDTFIGRFLGDTIGQVIIIAALILLSSESKLIIPKILLQEF